MITFTNFTKHFISILCLLPFQDAFHVSRHINDWISRLAFHLFTSLRGTPQYPPGCNEGGRRFGEENWCLVCSPGWVWSAAWPARCPNNHRSRSLQDWEKLCIKSKVTVNNTGTRMYLTCPKTPAKGDGLGRLKSSDKSLPEHLPGRE